MGKGEERTAGPALDADAAESCPNCGASLAGLTGREQRGKVERAGCPQCALQLVRRGGGPWEGIRG